MIVVQTEPVNTAHATALASFGERLMQSQAFFEGRGRVHEALDAVVRALEEAGIDYAIIGGLALNAHGYARETVDIDLLVTPDGLEAFRQRFEGLGYVAAHPGSRKRFRDTRTNVVVEFLTSGEFPGDGRPKPIVYPEPPAAAQDVRGRRVAALVPLIEFKLASGMTAPDRIRDLADVQELSRVLNLDETFAERLHPYVRSKFVELVRPLARRSDDAEEKT
jgi:hypothetical protein